MAARYLQKRHNPSLASHSAFCRACGVTLAPASFSFSGLRVERRLHSPLASLFNEKISLNVSDLKNWGEPMNQESNWNLIGPFGESLHSSEVVNARELKYCESCGGLVVRLQGSGTRLCPSCKPLVSAVTGRMQ